MSGLLHFPLASYHTILRDPHACGINLPHNQHPSMNNHLPVSPFPLRNRDSRGLPDPGQSLLCIILRIRSSRSIPPP